MAKKKRRRSQSDERTLLSVRVDDYGVRATASINSYVYAPQLAFGTEDDDPLYEFVTELQITGTCMSPESRAGDYYEVVLYGDDSPSRTINRKVHDVQAKDEYGAPKYRDYRGGVIPVFKPPIGMALLDKVRGEARWTTWVNVSPRLISDMLIVLGQGKARYLAVHERKINRRRWIHELSLQTEDPAQE